MIIFKIIQYDISLYNVRSTYIYRKITKSRHFNHNITYKYTLIINILY